MRRIIRLKITNPTVAISSRNSSLFTVLGLSMNSIVLVLCSAYQLALNLAMGWPVRGSLQMKSHILKSLALVYCRVSGAPLLVDAKARDRCVYVVWNLEEAVSYASRPRTVVDVLMLATCRVPVPTVLGDNLMALRPEGSLVLDDV